MNTALRVIRVIVLTMRFIVRWAVMFGLFGAY